MDRAVAALKMSITQIGRGERPATFYGGQAPAQRIGFQPGKIVSELEQLHNRLQARIRDADTFLCNAGVVAG